MLFARKTGGQGVARCGFPAAFVRATHLWSRKAPATGFATLGRRRRFHGPGCHTTGVGITVRLRIARIAGRPETRRFPRSFLVSRGCRPSALGRRVLLVRPPLDLGPAGGFEFLAGRRIAGGFGIGAERRGRRVGKVHLVTGLAVRDFVPQLRAGRRTPLLLLVSHETVLFGLASTTQSALPAFRLARCLVRTIVGLMRAAVLTTTDRGIYCPAGNFFIDPWRPVDRAVITHAHADHARAGHDRYLATPRTALVMRHRLGEIAVETMSFGEHRRIGDAAVSFHPAGHVPGSGQVRVEVGGEVWVVSGDYKTAPDRLSEP